MQEAGCCEETAWGGGVSAGGGEGDVGGGRGLPERKEALIRPIAWVVRREGGRVVIVDVWWVLWLKELVGDVGGLEFYRKITLIGKVGRYVLYINLRRIVKAPEATFSFKIAFLQTPNNLRLRE